MSRTGFQFGRRATLNQSGLNTTNMLFQFDSKDANSYNTNNPERWTDLISGNYLTSNGVEKFNQNEDALNLTGGSEYLTTATPFNIPAGNFSFGFYGKIIGFGTSAGGMFRSASNSRGVDWFFFYANDLSGWVRVNNDSFMGDGLPNYAVLGENHYYSFSFTDTIDGSYRSGTLKTYRDGVLFQEISPNESGGHTAKNIGFDIYNFNYQYATNQSIGQYLKHLHAYSRELTSEEMLANSNYLHSIHNV